MFLPKTIVPVVSIVTFNETKFLGCTCSGKAQNFQNAFNGQADLFIGFMKQ